MVKTGSNAYSTATLQRTFPRDSGVVPVSTSKNLPSIYDQQLAVQSLRLSYFHAVCSIFS